MVELYVIPNGVFLRADFRSFGFGFCVGRQCPLRTEVFACIALYWEECQSGDDTCWLGHHLLAIWS
jgi:hypothetical protein